MRDAAEGTAALARRIPALVAKAEQATGMVAEGGIKLHPETVDAIAAAQGRRRRPMLTLLWLAVILLLLILVLKE